MSKLQELINKLCPNGVEFKKLKELAEIGTGSSDKKDANMNGKYPFFVRSKNIEKHNAFEFDEEAIIIPGEGGIGDIFHYIKGKYALHQRVYRIHFTCDSINVKFAYYYLFAHFKSFIMKKAVSATVTSIRKPMIEDFFLPIPPIEVQEEIVRILDSFSDYAAELQAELQARKQQYEYYRNLLLTFNPSAYGCGTDDEQKDGVTTWGGHNYKIEWKKLGEICNRICSGGTPTTSNKSFYNGSIPWLRTQEVNWSDVYDTEIKISEEAVKKSSAKLIPSNCVIIAMYGATAAKVCINRIPLTTNQACCNLEINPQLASYKYVYYWLCNSYEKLKSMGEGSQNNINGMKIKQYPIPIPPLELQEKIVAILDRFETLVNDLTNGLPAEIAAVKDQYEYYRNKLLTFKKLSA